MDSRWVSHDDAHDSMMQELDPRTHLWPLPYASIQGCWVDLSRETDFEASSSYDTHDEQSLGWMKFEKAPDGSWIRRAERPVPQARGQGQVHPRVEEETEIREIKGGLNPQRDLIIETLSLISLLSSPRVVSLRPLFLSR